MNSAIQPVLIGSEIYRHYSFGANHPLVIPRVSTVIDIINALDWFVASDYRTAPRAKPKLLQQFHSQGYVDALQSIGLSQKVNALERQKYNLGTLSNPVFKEMFKRPATSVGSSILVAGGGSAYALGSGLYQGMAKHANGFVF
jgi:acetoin utilization protein AcuC